MNQDNGIYLGEASAFLADYCHTAAEPLGVELIGEGAWSRCFGFRRGDTELAIRFGHYVDDFENDRRAFGYATPALLIPQVLDIGRAFDGYYAISTRVRGVPLESVGAAHWLAVVPSVVSALEAMRTADVSASTGFGGWGVDGNAPSASWSAHLLEVDRDTAEMRSYGWHDKLAAFPQGSETFAWGFDLLKQVVSDAVPRCLLHGDLINRNVLVDRDGITGVFDWGCSRYGDPLYDLAWFEFWSPWYPALDVYHLRRVLEQRWRKVGYAPEEKEARLLACHLHIGLDHLAYNAYTGNGEALAATAEQMRALGAGAGKLP